MGSNRSKHNSSQSQSTSKKNLKSRTMSQQKPHVLQPFYFTEFIPKLRGFDNSPVNQNFSVTHFPDPARKSSRRSRRRTIYKPSPRVVNPVSATCICHISPNSVGTLLRSPDSSFSSIEYSPGTEAYESSLSEAEGANTFSSDSFDDVASWSSSERIHRPLGTIEEGNSPNACTTCRENSSSSQRPNARNPYPECGK